jgi:hypothetical protein
MSVSIFGKSIELIPLKSEKCFPLFADFFLLYVWNEDLKKSRLQEEVNEANVQYVGGGFGSRKTEGFLPEPTPAIELRKQKV